MNSKSVIERRTQPRTDVIGGALVIDGDDSATMYRIENLSAGGALLTGGPQLPLYQMVCIVLCLDGLSEGTIDARVMWHLDDGAGSGVAFVNVDATTEDLIQDIVLASLSNEAFFGQRSNKTSLPSWLP